MICQIRRSYNSDCNNPVTKNTRVNRGGIGASALLIFAALLNLSATIATAQTNNDGPGLTPLIYANEVETAAAIANQAAFESSNQVCNANGRFDDTAVPIFDNPGGGCTEEAFSVFILSRELVHTANQLQNAGPTIASLDLDQEGLGLALRWTAAEEFAAQSSMATDFANSQLSNLAARLSALRFGAQGFSFAGIPVNPEGDIQVAGLERRRGGGAASDEGGETYSPWGGFISGSFGWGLKVPTPLEDAFDFDGAEVTLGVDYRFDNNFVLGGMFGYTEQTVDFDEAASAISVVDGSIEAEGFSYIAFALFQGEKFSFSGSLGYQTVDFDAERNIKYPSFNPDLTSVNATVLSRPDSSVVMGTMNAGYAFRFQRLTFEPYVNVEYIDATIDQFTEDRSTNAVSSSYSRLFSLVINEQSIKSLDSALGVRFQLALTPSFAVIVPYITFEVHNEAEDSARTITADYSGLEALGLSGFAVATDRPDSSYTKAVAGLSMVLRGGRQRERGGSIFGGLQGYIQYTTIDGLQNYDDEVISGGFRYEF